MIRLLRSSYFLLLLPGLYASTVEAAKPPLKGDRQLQEEKNSSWSGPLSAPPAPKKSKQRKDHIEKIPAPSSSKSILGKQLNAQQKKELEQLVITLQEALDLGQTQQARSLYAQLQLYWEHLPLITRALTTLHVARLEVETAHGAIGYERAAAILENFDAPKEDPHWLPYHLLSARIAQKEQVAKALSHYRAALRLAEHSDWDKEDSECYRRFHKRLEREWSQRNERASRLFQAGFYQEALIAFESQLQDLQAALHPKAPPQSERYRLLSWQWRAVMVSARIEMGALKEAQALLQESKKQELNENQLLHRSYLLALTHALAGEHGRALQLLEKAQEPLQLKESHRLLKGRILMLMGQTSHARSLLKPILTSPTQRHCEQAHLLYAQLLAQINQQEEAIELLLRFSPLPHSSSPPHPPQLSPPRTTTSEERILFELQRASMICSLYEQCEAKCTQALENQALKNQAHKRVEKRAFEKKRYKLLTTILRLDPELRTHYAQQALKVSIQQLEAMEQMMEAQLYSDSMRELLLCANKAPLSLRERLTLCESFLARGALDEGTQRALVHLLQQPTPARILQESEAKSPDGEDSLGENASQREIFLARLYQAYLTSDRSERIERLLHLSATPSNPLEELRGQLILLCALHEERLLLFALDQRRAQELALHEQCACERALKLARTLTQKGAQEQREALLHALAQLQLYLMQRQEMAPEQELPLYLDSLHHEGMQALLKTPTINNHSLEPSNPPSENSQRIKEGQQYSTRSRLLFLEAMVASTSNDLGRCKGAMEELQSLNTAESRTYLLQLLTLHAACSPSLADADLHWELTTTSTKQAQAAPSAFQESALFQQFLASSSAHMAQKQLELPLDQVTLHIARQGAQLLLLKARLEHALKESKKARETFNTLDQYLLALKNAALLKHLSQEELASISTLHPALLALERFTPKEYLRGEEGSKKNLEEILSKEPHEEEHLLAAFYLAQIAKHQEEGLLTSKLEQLSEICEHYFDRQHQKDAAPSRLSWWIYATIELDLAREHLRAGAFDTAHERITNWQALLLHQEELEPDAKALKELLSECHYLLYEASLGLSNAPRNAPNITPAASVSDEGAGRPRSHRALEQLRTSCSPFYYHEDRYGGHDEGHYECDCEGFVS